MAFKLPVKVPFIPEKVVDADGASHFGWGGVVTAATIVFFAYIGFDAVSTQAGEAINPKKDMPFAIIASLLICLVGGSFYKQAPMRANPKSEERKNLISNEEGVWDVDLASVAHDEDVELLSLSSTPTGACVTPDKSGVQRRAN